MIKRKNHQPNNSRRPSVDQNIKETTQPTHKEHKYRYLDKHGDHIDQNSKPSQHPQPTNNYLPQTTNNYPPQPQPALSNSQSNTNQQTHLNTLLKKQYLYDNSNFNQVYENIPHNQNNQSASRRNSNNKSTDKSVEHQQLYTRTSSNIDPSNKNCTQESSCAVKTIRKTDPYLSLNSSILQDYKCHPTTGDKQLRTYKQTSPKLTATEQDLNLTYQQAWKLNQASKNSQQITQQASYQNSQQTSYQNSQNITLRNLEPDTNAAPNIPTNVRFNQLQRRAEQRVRAHSGYIQTKITSDAHTFQHQKPVDSGSITKHNQSIEKYAIARTPPPLRKSRIDEPSRDLLPPRIAPHHLCPNLQLNHQIQSRLQLIQSFSQKLSERILILTNQIQQLR